MPREGGSYEIRVRGRLSDSLMAGQGPHPPGHQPVRDRGGLGRPVGHAVLMPIAGLAIGAGTGALAGKLADVGIDDDTIKQIGQQLQQGKAAVFVLARSATTDRVIEAIKPFNPTVIQTSLSHDREEELVRALRS